MSIPDITTATGQEFIDALEACGATKPCGRCGHNDFVVLPTPMAFTSRFTLPNDYGGTVDLERPALANVVVCRVCRAVTLHGCGPGWGTAVSPTLTDGAA